MIGYIELLNQEVFESLGFTFDGSYWVKQPFPFKFQLNAEGTYSVIIDGMPVDQLPAPLKTNSELIQLMSVFARRIIEQAFQVAQQNNYDAGKAFAFVQAAIDKAFETPDVQLIKFVLAPAGQDLTIMPANEMTYTLMTGIQCKFVFSCGDIHEEEILIDPHCMSYDYLKENFPIGDNHDIKLEVYETEDKRVPFFGTGVFKPKQNEVTNKQ